MLCVCGVRRVVCSPSSAMRSRLLYLSATMPALAGEPAKTVWYRMDWGTSQSLTFWMITYFNSCQVKPWLHIHLKTIWRMTDRTVFKWLFFEYMQIHSDCLSFCQKQDVKTAVYLMICILLKAETLLNSINDLKHMIEHFVILFFNLYTLLKDLLNSLSREQDYWWLIYWLYLPYV